MPGNSPGKGLCAHVWAEKGHEENFLLMNLILMMERAECQRGRKEKRRNLQPRKPKCILSMASGDLSAGHAGFPGCTTQTAQRDCLWNERGWQMSVERGRS